MKQNDQYQERVLESLQGAAELVYEGEKELRETYLEAMILLVMCWSPESIPKREKDGQLSWTKP
jgi:hypothetical protein